MTTRAQWLEHGKQQSQKSYDLTAQAMNMLRPIRGEMAEDAPDKAASMLHQALTHTMNAYRSFDLARSATE